MNLNLTKIPTKILLNPITKEQEQICKDFADKSVESNMEEYIKRGQPNTNKVKTDIINGKKAEFMIYNHMVAENRKPDFPPDVCVYTKDKKSFSADLERSGQHIHVKSTIDGNKFGNSWLFQPNDVLITNPTNEDCIFFVVLKDVDPYFYKVRAVNLVGKYGKPVLTHLDKEAIYESYFDATQNIIKNDYPLVIHK